MNRMYASCAVNMGKPSRTRYAESSTRTFETKIAAMIFPVTTTITESETSAFSAFLACQMW